MALSRTKHFHLLRNENISIRIQNFYTCWNHRDTAKPSVQTLLVASYDHERLTDEQKKYATQAFVSLDDRHTGSIPNTKETVIDAVRLSGLNPTEIEIDQLMKGTGREYGDKLTKDEFLGMMTKVDWKHTDDVRDILKEDFRLFVDNRPVINEDEFIFILTREGRERMPLDEAKQIIAKFGKDQEGNIQLEELIDKLLAIAPT